MSLADARTWAADVLAGRGLTVSGELEPVRDRPWSLVARVPTPSGVFWFKENRAGTVYEAALVAGLSRWVPGRVLEPVAVDAARGWSLLPDGGHTVRDGGPPDPARWELLLTAHARLQRDLVIRVPEMLELGVPDVRPGRLPEALAALPVPPDVEGLLPGLRKLGEELEASPVPASLQHDDLHDANVFTDGRVFDWGDASVAHPFGVLLVTLRVAAQHFDPPVVQRLRDAYLEPWSDLAPRRVLLRDAEVATRLAMVGRALSWQRALRDATPRQVAELDDPVTGWLRELLEP